MSTVQLDSAVGFDYLDAYKGSGESETDNIVYYGGDQPWPPDREEVTFHITGRTSALPWFQRALDDLSVLLRLGPNWNNYGEKPVHTASAKRLIFILDRMKYCGPPVTIVPLPSGGLQIEWHRGPRSVEVEIPPAGNATGWYFDDESDAEVEWVVNNPGGLDELSRVISLVTES